MVLLILRSAGIRVGLSLPSISRLTTAQSERKIYLLPTQVNVQINLDVNLNKLGQPHVGRYECEPLNQSVFGPIGEMNDAPFIQRQL